jgi:hypothetical protein
MMLITIHVTHEFTHSPLTKLQNNLRPINSRNELNITKYDVPIFSYI